jgi:hypothetical protein
MDATQETIRLGKRCFVGNLAWKTSWQDLKDKFREAGNVVYTNVMRDDDGKGSASRLWASQSRSLDDLGIFRMGDAIFGRDQVPRVIFVALAAEWLLPTGRSKGWGIVEFETPEEVRGRVQDVGSAPGQFPKWTYGVAAHYPVAARGLNCRLTDKQLMTYVMPFEGLGIQVGL